MSWRAAPAVKAIFEQANAQWPRRNKASDGTIGDTAHSSRRSDHNPDSRGVVLAGDLTHDPSNGPDCHKIVDEIIARRDRRVKYLIWNRQIIASYPVGSSPAWARRRYTGSNPHTKHLHISVRREWENDTSPWWGLTPPHDDEDEEDVMEATLQKRGDFAMAVGTGKPAKLQAQTDSDAKLVIVLYTPKAPDGFWWIPDQFIGAYRRQGWDIPGDVTGLKVAVTTDGSQGVAVKYPAG